MVDFINFDMLSCHLHPPQARSTAHHHLLLSLTNASNYTFPSPDRRIPDRKMVITTLAVHNVQLQEFTAAPEKLFDILSTIF